MSKRTEAIEKALAAFLARYHNRIVNANLLFADIAEQAQAAISMGATTEELEEQAADCARWEKAVKTDAPGIWPSWVYEARQAIKHQNESIPWLADLHAALGWQGGTIYDALNAVHRLVAAEKERERKVAR